MSGYDVAICFAVAGIAAAAVDGVLLARRARAARASGADADGVDKQFGLGILRIAGSTVLALVLAVVWWHGTDSQQWDPGEVTAQTRKLAADITAHQPVPGEPSGGSVTFAQLMEEEADGFVGDGGRHLKAEQTTPPPGDVDAYTVTGAKTGSTGEDSDDPHPACLLFTSAERAPDTLPSGTPKSVRVPEYTVRTAVRAGRCP